MLPEAIRVPPDKLEENLPRIHKNRPVVAFCTRPDEGSRASLARKLQQRGVRKCVGASGRIPSMAERWIAGRAKTAGSLEGPHFNCHECPYQAECGDHCLHESTGVEVQ